MKAAIIGTVPDSRAMAPFQDPEWDIWACSAGNRGVLPRVTRWYELHGIIDLQGEENKHWAPDYFAWLRAQAFPVYMQEPNDLVPQALIFPWREILKRFGERGEINLTSSVAWMIAHAIMEGATEIGIFGVDMAATEEYYGQQKGGCQNWIIIAKEHGIIVHVPLESCLTSPPMLYGYGEASRMGRRLVARELVLKQNLARLDAEIDAKRMERQMFAGALDQVQYMRRTFVTGHHAELDEEQALPAVEQHKPLATFSTVSPSDSPETMPVERVGNVLVPKRKRGAAANGLDQIAGEVG